MTIYLCEFANAINGKETSIELNCECKEILDDSIAYEMDKYEWAKEYGWFLVAAKAKSKRGGKRTGAGRKVGTKGGGRPAGKGKWAGAETITVRIPKAIAPNIEKMIGAEESLKEILQLWEIQMQTATTDSITGKLPRTYDKAVKLIAELKQELLTLPIIV